MPTIGPAPLVLRTDAGARIGGGHLLRCLALAEAWMAGGGRATFVLATRSAALEARLVAAGADLVHLDVDPGASADCRATASLARDRGAHWVVVDGYHFGADYQEGLRTDELRVLFIDDHGHAAAYPADVVLNQNLCAREALYAARARDTTLLLGPRYALVRQEFRRQHHRPRSVPALARKVLVSCGSGDATNAWRPIVEAFTVLPGDAWEATLVVGGLSASLAEARAATATCPFPVRVEHDTRSMPDWIAWADIAVAAAGTILWEMALLGLPVLAIAVADNHLDHAAALAQAGSIGNLGWHQDLTPAVIARELAALAGDQMAREAMSAAGRALVDGHGASRVASFLCGGA